MWIDNQASTAPLFEYMLSMAYEKCITVGRMKTLIEFEEISYRSNNWIIICIYIYIILIMYIAQAEAVFNPSADPDESMNFNSSRHSLGLNRISIEGMKLVSRPSIGKNLHRYTNYIFISIDSV